MAGAAKPVEPSSSSHETAPRKRVGTVGVKSAIVVALLSVIAIFIVPNFVKEEKQIPENLPVAEYETPPSVPFQHIPVMLDFYNRHDVPLDLYWANHDQPEVKMATIQPGASQQFHSYVRHIWIWRIASTQEYVKSFVVENDKVTDVYSKFESSFHEDYLKEKGFNWINVYPRSPMVKWVADPVEIGHEVQRTVSPGYYTAQSGVAANDSTITLTMKTLSIMPKIFVIDNFLSEDECDFIIKEAETSGEMKRSGVKTSGEHIAARTSTNMWMGAERSKVVENIFRRGFQFMNVEFNLESWKQHAESLQVLSYEVTQEYQPHDDYFKPSDYPTYKAVQEGKNRYATLFLYLSDVEEGGETVFPRMGNQYVTDACTVPEGFRVPPKKGRAALFFTMLPDGNLDHNALHGGCPVITGRKWAANFWFWDPVSGDAW